MIEKLEEKKHYRIRPWMVDRLTAPTPRNYSDSKLYYDEKLEIKYPNLLPPSFLQKRRVKLRERVRYAFEEILILIAKKMNGVPQ